MLAGACLLGLVGCTGNSGGLAVPIPCADGATYYVILGLGVVAVNDAKPSAAVATGVQSLGLVVSDRPGLRVGLGYTSGSVVAVPDGARDVRIEVSRRPFGPVQVDVQSALLASPTPGAPAEP